MADDLDLFELSADFRAALCAVHEGGDVDFPLFVSRAQLARALEYRVVRDHIDVLARLPGITASGAII